MIAFRQLTEEEEVGVRQARQDKIVDPYLDISKIQEKRRLSLEKRKIFPFLE
jgi:hypothetical protein